MLLLYSMWPWLEYVCTAFTNGIRRLLFILRRAALTDLFGFLLFLPDAPSVNQQIATDLTLSQPFFSFFAVVIFAPLTEEIVFRGMLARYLFPKQDNSKRTLIFLLVSSLLFALIHFPGDVQQFFVYFSLGFSLGLAYISRKGLVYSISLHALNNVIGFLMILML